ncbi:MAG: PDZ domain-containing protein [Deltaproteobacteria bacterium]|nr:PDZ domain-containing protein [Deltaproteobacteria bacterium]
MKESDNLGIKTSDMSPEIANHFGYSEGIKGVVVLEVTEGSKAEKAGVRPGDIVVAVNRVKVRTAGDYRGEIKRVDEGKELQLLLRRGGAGFIALSIPT